MHFYVCMFIYIYVHRQMVGGFKRWEIDPGTFLLSRIRDAMNMDMPLGEKYVDCALLTGGNIRGGREYKDDEHINLEVLQTEIEDGLDIYKS